MSDFLKDNKPKYIEKIYAIVFLCLGFSFLAVAFFCFTGILKPKADSYIQSSFLMGIVFSAVSAFFLVLQAVFFMINSTKEKQYNELLAEGRRIQGTVEKISLQAYTHYGSKSPYRINYAYEHLGKIYHEKSCLLWEKPAFHRGDSITVYADDRGKSTVKV